MKKDITGKLIRIGMSVALIVLTGCASIKGKPNWPVNFESNPAGAEVVIKDNSGNEIDRGITPATFILKSSSSFFEGATYYVEFKLNDYQIRKTSFHALVNGWWYGNICFGGLGAIGALIIDPANGTMYKLPPLCSVNFSKVESSDVKQ